MTAPTTVQKSPTSTSPPGPSSKKVPWYTPLSRPIRTAHGRRLRQWRNANELYTQLRGPIATFGGRGRGNQSCGRVSGSVIGPRPPPDGPGRVARHPPAGRHVRRDHGPRPHPRPAADGDALQDDRPDPDPPVVADHHRPADQRRPATPVALRGVGDGVPPPRVRVAGVKVAVRDGGVVGDD